MEKLKLYTVVKSSSDNTIMKGDIVWLSLNNDLNSTRNAGWLTKEEWDSPKTKDFEVEECREYYLDVYNGCEHVRKVG